MQLGKANGGDGYHGHIQGFVGWPALDEHVADGAGSHDEDKDANSLSIRGGKFMLVLK